MIPGCVKSLCLNDQSFLSPFPLASFPRRGETPSQPGTAYIPSAPPDRACEPTTLRLARCGRCHFASLLSTSAACGLTTQIWGYFYVSCGRSALELDTTNHFDAADDVHLAKGKIRNTRCGRPPLTHTYLCIRLLTLRCAFTWFPDRSSIADEIPSGLFTPVRVLLPRLATIKHDVGSCVSPSVHRDQESGMLLACGGEIDSQGLCWSFPWCC